MSTTPTTPAVSRYYVARFKLDPRYFVYSSDPKYGRPLKEGEFKYVVWQGDSLDEALEMVAIKNEGNEHTLNYKQGMR